MTVLQGRAARLARILALRKAALRASEAGAAMASASARLAQARSRQVVSLVRTACATQGDTSLAVVRGAATLRALLHPVQAAAAQQAHEAAQKQGEATRRLTQSDAQHGRALKDYAAAQQAVQTESDERESADRIHIKPGRQR